MKTFLAFGLMYNLCALGGVLGVNIASRYITDEPLEQLSDVIYHDFERVHGNRLPREMDAVFKNKSDDLQKEASKFSFFSNNGISAHIGNGPNGNTFVNRIAECSVTQNTPQGQKVGKFYMRLEDAEYYGQKLLQVKQNPAIDGKSVEALQDAQAGNVQDPDVIVDFKCTPVTLNSEDVKCAFCVYSEVLVPHHHIRSGTIKGASVLECMNGYDNSLTQHSASRYFTSSNFYHPLCLA